MNKSSLVGAPEDLHNILRRLLADKLRTCIARQLQLVLGSFLVSNRCTSTIVTIQLNGRAELDGPRLCRIGVISSMLCVQVGLMSIRRTGRDIVTCFDRVVCLRAVWCKGRVSKLQLSGELS